MQACRDALWRKCVLCRHGNLSGASTGFVKQSMEAHPWDPSTVGTVGWRQADPESSQAATLLEVPR